MRGNNRLELNDATVMEAIQEYLDKRAYAGRARFEVSGVGYNGSYFTIVTKERDIEEEEEYTDRPPGC